MIRRSLLLALAVALPAAAQTSPSGLIRQVGVREPEPPHWSRSALSLVLRGGMAAGIGVGPRLGLALAYAPPILDRQLRIALDTAWTHPFTETTPGTGFAGSTVDQVDAIVLATYHWMPARSFVAPYVGIGGGVSALRATMQFTSAPDRSVRELRGSGVAVAGAQFQVGPGAIEIEGRGQYSPSQTNAFNGSSITPFTFTAGYRMPLGG
jgi:ABC-type amino acid transport substrate-binding protein